MINVKRIAALSAAALLCLRAAVIPDVINPVKSAYSGNAPVSCVYADESKKIVSNALYTISPRLSGKFVTAAADNNVHQWEALGDSSQKWRIVSTDDGYCRILSANEPHLAMTVENGNDENGNNIFLSEYTGTQAQQFMLHRTDDAYYITGRCSGNAALDVYDISSENGANIDQWDYWGGEGQKFRIYPINNEYTLPRGDINTDGAVNVIDAALQKRGCLNGFDEIAGQLADANADEATDATDARLLSGFILGADVALADGLCSIPYNNSSAAYLFAYFLGNDASQERLSYAVSTDGYNFRALNEGQSVWKSSVGTGCIRDPFILKGEDGAYYMLATDMQSSLGWNSNRNIISAKSTDLIHWTDETLIEIANKSPLMQGADRAWAPQAIYDPAKSSYMIYWAARVPNRDPRTIMYYAYSKDMKKLDTEPQLLFAPASGDDAIDSDIIFRDGKYYMYYKNETNKRLYLATADNASGPYKEIKQVSEGSTAVEGPNIYNITGTDRWIMMSDAYTSGHYIMQETTDMQNFTSVNGNAYSFDFTPRHGYVIPISYEQYGALVGAFPSSSVMPYNTAMEAVRLSVSSGEKPDLPESVSASYSDGGTMDFPVKWNDTELAAVNTSRRGTYTVTGTVGAVSYANPLIEERADPYIVDGNDGYYYFTASYPAYGSVNNGYDRIILRRSETVAGLADAEEKTIWKAHSSGTLAKHIWAPEMHRIGGAWYIYFAAGNSDDIWHIRPYVLKCSGDPYTGAWTECGQMQAASGDSSSFTSFSLDMTYFEHNGKHYVIWAEIKGDSSLFMAEVNPAEPYKLTCAPILLTKPEYDWELVNNRVNEGASVLKTDKKVYIFFSASGTGSEYCVGRLEANAAADLMKVSSWKKLPAPVLTTANLTGEAGPGHNCFVTDESGKLLLVYHARPEAHSSGSCATYNSNPLYDPCRHTRIKGVYFAADGSPVIGMNDEQLLSSRFRIITATVTVK